jgi:hypothetical protein
MEGLDEQFDRLAQDVIRKANRIQCPIDDYVAGLKQIQEEIQTAIDAARGK